MKKILFFSLISSFCYSQIVDSNKNTINEFYDGLVKSVEINGAKAKGQFLISTKPKKYVYTKRPDISSAVKNKTLLFNIGVTNTSDFLNLNKFDFKENNGYTVGFTYQHAFNEVYLALDSINNNPLDLKTFIISIDYQKDKFNNYNPSNNEINKATPEKLILKGGWSLYKFHHKNKAKFKYTWIPSIFGKINLIGYNENSLQNYLLNDKISSVNDIVFTKNSNFDGKYGIIENNIKSAQISFSLPFVPHESFLKLPIISPIPYFSYGVFDNNKPRFNTGIAFGFLSTSIVGKESKKKGGGVYRKFNVPSFLTFGIDWNYQDGNGSKPNYFISGSIKLK